MVCFTIGTSFNHINYYQTYISTRNACKHKLDKYERATNWRPTYYGYVSREDAVAAWRHYQQTGVALRNPRTYLQSPTHQHASPRSPHDSPTPSQRGVTRMSSPAARGMGSLPPPQYSILPPPSQPRALITRQPARPAFFVVLVGHAPGVYTTR